MNPLVRSIVLIAATAAIPVALHAAPAMAASEDGVPEKAVPTKTVSGTVVPEKVVPVPAVPARLSPAVRGSMARTYVRRWGAFVQKAYGVPVDVWARRMVPSFVLADADNFRAALSRTTFEGASAALNGRGDAVSDAQVVDSMARARLAPRDVQPQVLAKALGSLASDLVYTPVTPCRILDTRLAGGALAGGFSRDFNAVVGSGGDFTSQGGSATDCGVVAAGQAAVVINLAAVRPTGNGYAIAYPFGASLPTAASLNYAAGAVVNNSVVLKLPSPLTTKDFTVFTFATSDFVADIVGYYAPPVATALQCTREFGNPTSVPANTYGFGVSAVCPTGYTATGLGIEAPANVVMADSAISSSGGTVFTYNLGGTAQSTRAWVQCCRVPGR